MCQLDATLYSFSHCPWMILQNWLLLMMKMMVILPRCSYEHLPVCPSVQHTWKITASHGKHQNSRFPWIPWIRDYRLALYITLCIVVWMMMMMMTMMTMTVRSTCSPDGRTNFIIARPRLVGFHQAAVRIWQIVIVTVDHIPRYCAAQKHLQSHVAIVTTNAIIGWIVSQMIQSAMWQKCHLLCVAFWHFSHFMSDIVAAVISRCFATAGPHLWHSLPSKLRQCHSLAKFK